MLIYKITRLMRREPLCRKRNAPRALLAHAGTCPSRVAGAPRALLAHTGTCPSRLAPGATGAPRRAEQPGAVRLGFVPDEWFVFFRAKTGVSGPYLFALVVANYLFSKELYVMEHEYYTALSIGPMMYFAATKLGPQLAAWLDEDVEEFGTALEKRRVTEASVHRNAIDSATAAQRSAEAQKLLIEAKKENVAMQLEAAYRERCALLHRNVRARLDYQVKLFRAEARIQQKWMLQWILQNVMKSITPEFEKAFLSKAIEDVAALARRNSP